jgi:hypothetical protein
MNKQILHKDTNKRGQICSELKNQRRLTVTTDAVVQDDNCLFVDGIRISNGSKPINQNFQSKCYRNEHFLDLFCSHIYHKYRLRWRNTQLLLLETASSHVYANKDVIFCVAQILVRKISK